ncbi:MAG TPA: peptidyl-prolyl cis-trans isomerase [Thermoanaerobaculia bacterium]|nr:peptidyl-prolyl cis-trans isomerase [Thermoanaerobaculia bacterium]
MKKTLLILALTALCGTLAAGEIVEEVVARVGDRVVTRSLYMKRLTEGLAEMEARLPPEELPARQTEFRKALLDDMINELLLKDRADRINVTVSPAEIEAAVARLRRQFGIETDEQFIESLQRSGLTRADMEVRLRDTLLTEKLFARELRSRDALGDRELRERYEREKEHYRLPERARLREIVVLAPEGATTMMFEELRARADEALAAARREPDFAKVVTEYSDAPSKSDGGTLGIVARGELLPELDRAVFDTPASTVVGPVRTRAGYHIVKVEERLPSEVPPFDAIKDRLRREATEETFQRDLKAYLESLRKDAFVQIHEDRLPTTG